MLLSEQYQNSRLVDGLTEMLRGRGARVHPPWSPPPYRLG